MPTTFRPYAPDQELLLPASLLEWRRVHLLLVLAR